MKQLPKLRLGARLKFLKEIWAYLKERWIINRSIRIASGNGTNKWVEKMTNWQRCQWARYRHGRGTDAFERAEYYANLVHPNRK